MSEAAGGAAAHRPRPALGEWRWALAWSCAIAVVTSLPYVLALALTPPQAQYLGFVYNPDDLNVHLSWIRQAKEGAIFFSNLFTSEPHVGRFFNLFMLAAGKKAALFGLTPYQVWAAARVLGAFLLSLVAFAAVARYTRQRIPQRLGLAVVTLSSGLGWWATAVGWRGDPVDVEPNLVMPEAFTFHSLYLNPLFAWSTAILVLGLLLGERALRRGSWPAALGAGLLGLLLGGMHTYDTIPFLAVLGVYLAVRAGRERAWHWDALGRYLVIVLLTAPTVLYQAQLIQSDALYAAKANTITATPPLLTMLVSYGLLVPLALIALVADFRRRREAVWFFAVWLVVHGLCCYAPTSLLPFQRKMIEGFHVPLAVLATGGLWQTARWLAGMVAVQADRARQRRLGPLWPVRCDTACRRAAWTPWLALVGLLLLLPSTLQFLQSTVDNVAANNGAKLRVFMPPFHVPLADYRALQWMEAELPADAVVLCFPWIGNYVPPLTGKRVFVGHWAETIDYGRKLNAAREFLLGPGSAAEKRAFLHQNGITHFYYGTYERELSGGQFPLLPELRRVYPVKLPPNGQPLVAIYAVGPAPPPVDLEQARRQAKQGSGR